MSTAGGRRQDGRRGWTEPKSLSWCVRGWPTTCAVRPPGRWTRAAQCRFLSVQVPPSLVSVSEALKTAQVRAGLVTADPSLLRSGRMETSGSNWTFGKKFASLRFGHKAAATSYAALREVETEYNHPLVESSPRTSQHT